MGAKFDSIENNMIRIDEQTDLSKLQEEIGNKNPKLYETIKKWQKIEVAKENDKEKVLYITKTQLAATKVDFNIEKLEEQVTDTYEIFQETKLAEKFPNTENLQNVSEMIDDFSENILFTGDNPIIKYKFKPEIRKNIITGLSLKISDLLVSDPELASNIKKLNDGNLMDLAGTAFSTFLGTNGDLTKKLEGYRTSLEGLNKIPAVKLNNPRNVKYVIDNLIENNGTFTEKNNEKYDKEFKISDLKGIGDSLANNLITKDIATTLSSAAALNSDNNNLSGKEKIKLFFSSSMGEPIKKFFESNTILGGIITFLLKSFLGIDINKLMGNDKLTKEKIPNFREDIKTWGKIDGKEIKNSEKLFSNDGNDDISTANRLYGIKELLKSPDNKDLKDVFFDIQKNTDFNKIKNNLSGEVINSNNEVTENMDKTINLYYDFLSQKSSEKPLNINDFIKSKKEEIKKEVVPTTTETEKWIKKSPEMIGDKIEAIIEINKKNYKILMNKNGTVIIKSEIPEIIKYKLENEIFVEAIQKNWNNPDFIKGINQEKLIDIIGKTINKSNGKFNNNTSIIVNFKLNDKDKNGIDVTFIKENIEVPKKEKTDTSKKVATIVTAGTVIATTQKSEPDQGGTIKTKTEPLKEKVITKKTTNEVINDETKKITLSEINSKIPKINGEIQINDKDFTLKYDNTYTIKINDNNTIYVKIKGKNNEYKLLKFENTNSNTNKKLIKKVLENKKMFENKLTKKLAFNTITSQLKPVIKQIDKKTINLGKSSDGKENYGTLILKEKFSTEVKTVEEVKKEMVKEKSNPSKKKVEKAENLAVDSTIKGIKYIQYRNIVGGKMSGEIQGEKFSIQLKKINGKNPLIFVEIGGKKFQSEIIKDKETFSWNTVLSKVSSDKYDLTFNGKSEIIVNSDADFIGNIEGGDFTINPEELIRTIKINMDTLDVIPWNQSPTPGTKMVFK